MSTVHGPVVLGGGWTGAAVVGAPRTGLSAVGAAHGSVEARSELFAPRASDGEVALDGGTATAARLGPAPEYVPSALGIGAAIWSAVRRRRGAPVGVPTTPGYAMTTGSQPPEEMTTL
jgi:apolipoprotein N-acyltransferase